MKRKSFATSVAAFALVASTFALTPAVAADGGVSPSGLTSTVANGGLEFKWEAVANASGYQVQLSSDANFSTILETEVTYARNWAPRRNYGAADGSSRLYWRVAAFYNGNTLDLSSYAEDSVMVDSLPKPALASPANGASINYPDAVALSWDTTPGALAYEVQIAANNDFSNDSTVIKHTNIEGTSLSLATLPDGNWGWRVLARHFTPDGKVVWSAPSAALSFSKQWPASASRVQPTTPAPAGSTVPAVTDPLFSWEPVAGASYYKIAVARDAGFTNIAIPETQLYGTSFIPKGYLLNGQYFWKVTAYDVDGNPGQPSNVQQFIKRWGKQASAYQETANEPEARPIVTAANTGSTSAQAPQTLMINQFELKWQAVPRVNKYRLEVKSLSGTGAVYSCTTPNTSATMTHSYSPGLQSPELFKSDGNCFGYILPKEYVQGGLITPTYQWRVYGVDASASGETYGQGALVTAESEPRYFRLTCDNGNVCGGTGNFNNITPTAWASGGVLDTSAPSPLMEWEAVPGTCDTTENPRPREYEVRVYRGAVDSTTTEIARFRTFENKLRPAGTFRDDNVSTEPYNWRVRVVCDHLYYGDEWDQPSRVGIQWIRTTEPVNIPSSYMTEQNGAIQLNWTPQHTTIFGSTHGSPLRDGTNMGYRLQYRKQGTVNWNAVDLEYPAWIPADAYGWPLSPDTYEFRVAPLDSNFDVGRYSELKSFTIAPSVPAGLTATTVGSSSVQLKWNAAAVASGYQVQKQKGSGAWENMAIPGSGDTTKQTVASALNLDPGTYRFRVRTMANGYYSQWSSPAQATLDSKTVSLSTAEGAVLATNNRTLKWLPVDGASRYLVYLATSSSGLANAWPIETVNPFLTITNDFTFGTQYYWRVVAVSENLWSNRIRLGQSAARSFYVSTPPRTSPYSTLQLVEGLKVRASWDALPAEQAGASSGVTYQVRYRKANQVPADTWVYSTPSASTSYLTGDLSANTSYEVQLSAINSSGQGPWSASNTISTAGTPNSPTNLTVTPQGETSVDVGWWTPWDNGSPITRYVVSWKANSASDWKSATVAANVNTYKINGLTRHTSYQVQVQAVNGVGAGPYATHEVTTAGFPTAPTKRTVRSGNGYISFTWNAPSSNGSSPRVGYVVEGITSGGVWTELGRPTAASFKHEGLLNGQTWKYRVRAFNAQGMGPYSALITERVGKPSAPKVTLSSSKGKVTAKWKRPSAGGAPIKSYALQYSTDGKKWKTLVSKTSKLTFTTKKGQKGKYLYVRGLSKNKYGSSPWGATAKVKKK